MLRAVGAFNVNNAGYNSDIYYGSAPEPVPDGTFAAGPTLRAMLPLGRKLVLEATANPQYIFYFESTNERAWNVAGAANAHVIMNKLYFLAGADYSNTRERMAAELDINVRRKQVGVTGLALWQLSRVFSVAAQGREVRFEFNDQAGLGIRENLNRRERLVNMRAYLQQGARVRLSADLEYGDYVFTADPTSLRNSQSYGVYAGVEYLPETTETAVEGVTQSRGLTGTIHLGYNKLDVRNPLQRDYGGLAGNVMLATTFLRHLSIRGFFERSAEFSVYSGVFYYIQMNYGGGLTYSLSRRIDLSYDLSFAHSDYAVGGGGGQPLEQFDNRYQVHAVRIGFRLRRNLNMDLLANFSTRRGNELVPEGGRNFFGFSLSYGYSPGATTLITNPLAR
jgi:hypothetical protein